MFFSEKAIIVVKYHRSSPKKILKNPHTRQKQPPHHIYPESCQDQQLSDTIHLKQNSDIRIIQTFCLENTDSKQDQDMQIWDKQNREEILDTPVKLLYGHTGIKKSSRSDPGQRSFRKSATPSTPALVLDFVFHGNVNPRSKERVSQSYWDSQNIIVIKSSDASSFTSFSNKNTVTIKQPISSTKLPKMAQRCHLQGGFGGTIFLMLSINIRTQSKSCKLPRCLNT